MAIVNAVKSGNWSDPTVWSTGSVPVDGDIVSAVSFVVEFNVDIDQPNTILQATTGRFNYGGTGSRTVKADASSGQFSGTNGLIRHTGSGSLFFIGNVKGSDTTGAASGIIHAGAGLCVVHGTVTGGNLGYSTFGASNTSSGRMEIDVAIGGLGMIGPTPHGASNTSIGTLIVGTAIGNGWGPGSAVIEQAAGVAGGRTVGQVTRVKRIQSGPFGMSGIVGAVFIEDDPTNTSQLRLTPNGTTKTLADPATFADSPVPADVRAGTEYNNGNNVGTCAVPLPGQTVVGVPVDDTVGTAVLTAEALLATLQPSGPYRLTISTLDGVDLVPGVGLSIVGVSNTNRTTDAAGPVAFDLAAGEYLVRVSVPFGFAPVADVPVTLPGPDDDLDVEIALDRLAVTPPGSGNLCRVSLRVADESDVPWVGVSILAALTSGPAVGATLHANRGEPTTTDDDGMVDLDLLRGQAYTLTARRPDGVEVTVTRTIPDLANADLSMLLPA